MSVIQYRDKQGNIRTVNSIKGDRGPRGPAGAKGEKGDKGDKGGSLIRGSVKTVEDLNFIPDNVSLEIGDGYIVEDENTTYIWDGTKWVKSPSLQPIDLDELSDVEISDAKHNDALVYDFNLNKWVNKPVQAESGGGTTSIIEDITVTNPNGVGGYNENTVIKAGTTFQEFAHGLLTRTTPPTYIKPTLTMECDIDEVVTRGSTINPTLTVHYDSGDAGKIRFCYLYRNDSKLDTFTKIDEFINPGVYTLNGGDVTYKLEVFYEEGEIKLNNENILDPTGMIKRGSISAEITIKEGISYWAYEKSDYDYVNPLSLLSLKETGYGLKNGDTLEVNCNSKSNSLVFIYPSSLGDAKSINYIGFDPNSIDIFTKYTINIYDINYKNPIEYNVYQYNSLISIGNAKFVLKI